MSSLKNRVSLIGHVGQDPEVKEFNGSGRLARFSLATNEVYRNAKGEKVEDTQWHRLIAWNKTAELVEKMVKKGSEVAIDGKLVTNSYEDSKGEKRYNTEIKVDEFVMLGPKKAG